MLVQSWSCRAHPPTPNPGLADNMCVPSKVSDHTRPVAGGWTLGGISLLRSKEKKSLSGMLAQHLWPAAGSRRKLVWSLHPSIQPCHNAPAQREIENTVSSPRYPEPPSPSRPILAAKVNSTWNCLLIKRIAHFCKEERVLGLTAGTLPPTRHKHPKCHCSQW